MVDINTITNIEEIKNDVDYTVACPTTGRVYIMCVLGDMEDKDKMIVLSSKQLNYRGRRLYLVDSNDECGFTSTRLLELIKTKEYLIVP